MPPYLHISISNLPRCYVAVTIPTFSIAALAVVPVVVVPLFVAKVPAVLAFAAVAVALAVVGVYGVLTYLVGQRTREIGVRLALGASPSGVVWLFVREGAALTLVGLIVGLAGALAAGRWISALLFGVTPADPVTLAIVLCALAGAAAGATYVPARRAAGVDPSDALRAE